MPGLLASLLLGYALGSVPVAYLLARAWGVDIFSVGTGNPGAANVFRAVGRGPGSLVFLADAMKGAGAVLLARALGVAPELVVLAGAAAVVGHWYPLALRFRGGAGLATALGVGLGLLPLAGLVALGPGLAALLRLRSTGPAAAVGNAAFVLASIFLGGLGGLLLAAEATALLALVRLQSSLLARWRPAASPRR